MYNNKNHYGNVRPFISTPKYNAKLRTLAIVAYLCLAFCMLLIGAGLYALILLEVTTNTATVLFVVLGTIGTSFFMGYVVAREK